MSRKRKKRLAKKVAPTEAMLRATYTPQALCSRINREKLLDAAVKNFRKTGDESWATYIKYKDSKEPFYIRGVITPGFAAYALKYLNANNRDVGESHLRGLVTLSEANSFQETGDSVKFATTAVVLDAQHRMWMALITNKNVPTCMAFGLAPGVKQILDEFVKKRNAKDVAEINGMELLPGMEPASRLILAYTEKATGYVRMSNIEAVTNACETLVGLREIAEAVYGNNKRSKLPKNAVLTAAAWLVYKDGANNMEDVIEFFQSVKAGDAPADDARWHLHNQLREKMGIGKGNQFHGRIRCIKWCIYAWNQYCAGRASSYLKWAVADGYSKHDELLKADVWHEVTVKDK